MTITLYCPHWMLSNLEDFMSGKNSFVMLNVKANDEFDFPVVIDLEKCSLEQGTQRHILLKVTKRI